MKVVALTGGIGSGKSFVADEFAKLGVPVVDADQVAFDITQDPAICRAIITRFGECIIDSQGNIDRKALQKHIFQDPLARAWLEAYLHPLILAEMDRRVAKLQASYCIVVIPLLAESGLAKRYDFNVVVDAPVEIQKQRTASRDQLSTEQIDDMIGAQASRDERLRIADQVINNAGSKSETAQEVLALHHLIK